MKKKQTAFRLNEESLEELKAMAKADNRSLAYMVQVAIDHYLREVSRCKEQ